MKITFSAAVYNKIYLLCKDFVREGGEGDVLGGINLSIIDESAVIATALDGIAMIHVREFADIDFDGCARREIVIPLVKPIKTDSQCVTINYDDSTHRISVMQGQSTFSAIYGEAVDWRKLEDNFAGDGAVSEIGIDPTYLAKVGQVCKKYGAMRLRFGGSSVKPIRFEINSALIWGLVLPVRISAAD